MVLKICKHKAFVESQVTLGLEPSSYKAVLGESAKITCLGWNLQVGDLVWQIYPHTQPLSTTVIFLTGRQVVFTSLSNNDLNSHHSSGYDPNRGGLEHLKYVVVAEQISPNAVKSSLTISNINWTDAGYSYQCACNIYTACANGRKVNAVANLTVLIKQEAKSQSSSCKLVSLFE